MLPYGIGRFKAEKPWRMAEGIGSVPWPLGFPPWTAESSGNDTEHNTYALGEKGLEGSGWHGSSGPKKNHNDNYHLIVDHVNGRETLCQTPGVSSKGQPGRIQIKGSSSRKEMWPGHSLFPPEPHRHNNPKNTLEMSRQSKSGIHRFGEADRRAKL